MKKLTIGITNYNNDVFLGILLGEIMLQCKHDNLFEYVSVVIYDDCSTNINSLAILEEYEKYFTIVKAKKNSGGPSVGRNYIIDNCNSEYILFIDSDDLIVGNIKKILKELEVKKDIYVSDIKKISSDGNISSSTMIYSWTLFEGGVKKEDIKKLVVHQTGIWSIYNIAFLNDNNLRYLTDTRYEDNIFFYSILMKNPELGILREKYYGWRNNYKSFSHGDMMLSARLSLVAHTLNMLEENEDSEYAPYILYSIWNQTITNIVRNYPSLSSTEYHTYYDALMVLFNKHPELVKRLRNRTDYSYSDIFYKMAKNRILNRYTFLRGFKELKCFVASIKRCRFDALSLFRFLPMNDKKIFLTSQYGHYNDNSKYLYLEMKKDPKYKNHKFIFAVKSEYADVKSNKDFINYSNWILHYYHHYTSKEVYFDTWYNPRIYKRDKQVWTQLWHGYPFKKVHTDINTYTSTFSNYQILSRHMGINKWDFVWSVDDNNTKIFSRIFKDIKIIEKQYPKIQFLVDNIDNEKLISDIKKSFNLDENQKYIIYAPTYRPYNYYLDMEDIKHLVPEDHKLIVHLHPLMKTRILNQKVIDYIHIKKVEDIQPLLLCMDHLITDCSSLIYDFEQMEKPVTYYFKDSEIYDKVHGIY